jgi:hypothetical protein
MSVNKYSVGMTTKESQKLGCGINECGRVLRCDEAKKGKEPIYSGPI